MMKANGSGFEILARSMAVEMEIHEIAAVGGGGGPVYAITADCKTSVGTRDCTGAPDDAGCDVRDGD
jgi:hypothetical protein